MKTWVGIHADTNLTDDWWAARGYRMGEYIFYNSIRDGSGRFDGYCVVLSRKLYVMRTVEQAEEAIRRMTDGHVADG